MSQVTNAILTYSVLENTGKDDPLLEVNKFFDGSRGFVSCDTPELPLGWYGGTKMLETNVAIGSFNYLRLDELLEHLAKIKWEEPENVQLFAQEQEDERFTVHLVAPKITAI